MAERAVLIPWAELRRRQAREVDLLETRWRANQQAYFAKKDKANG